jgi:hypothetical protein
VPTTTLAPRQNQELKSMIMLHSHDWSPILFLVLFIPNKERYWLTGFDWLKYKMPKNCINVLFDAKYFFWPYCSVAGKSEFIIFDVDEAWICDFELFILYSILLFSLQVRAVS